MLAVRRPKKVGVAQVVVLLRVVARSLLRMWWRIKWKIAKGLEMSWAFNVVHVVRRQPQGDVQRQQVQASDVSSSYGTKPTLMMEVALNKLVKTFKCDTSASHCV